MNLNFFKEKKLNKLLPYLLSILIIIFYFFGVMLSVELVQTPFSLWRFWSISGVIFSAIGFILSLFLLNSNLKTKFEKETCWYVIFVVLISLMCYSIINVVLRLDFPSQWILVPSAIGSAILSYILSGHSKQNIFKKIKKLLFNQITLITVFLFTLMPIVDYTLSFTIHSRGVIARYPSWEINQTGNTSLVNGSVNGTAFFAKVPVYKNQTFEATNLVELVITDWENTLPLTFKLHGFQGDFSVIDDFKISFVYGSKRLNVLNVDAGIIQINETQLELFSEIPITFEIMCTGKNITSYTQNPSLFLTIYYSKLEMFRIHLFFDPIYY